MSVRGHSQNFTKLNFLHIFIALLKEAHFPLRNEAELISA